MADIGSRHLTLGILHATDFHYFGYSLGFLANRPEQAVFFGCQKVIAGLLKVYRIATTGAFPGTPFTLRRLKANKVSEWIQ